ncbi:unnamed protein product [Caretta caretta]
MEGLVVNLVNIYAPQMSSRRPQFYQQVSDFLGTLDSHECLVLGGDFNTTLEERDRSGAEPSPAAANILQGIVDHHSLVDVWRDHHPDDTSTFTFVRVEAHRSHHSRLDRIYLSRFHLSQAHSSAVRPAPFSDHHLVTVTVSLRAERPGPAYWHFNNSLLEDESFVMSFREFWLAWREQWRAFPSVRRWWDLGKVRAKLFCRDYTRGTSRRRNAAIEQLEREVLEMERRLAADPEDPSLCGACREKREELRALEDHRARGAFVRSRIRLLREMDRGSRFFYALEKTRGAKKHVTCLLAEDGTPLTDPEEMCGRARDFYTSLFSPDPTDPDACEVLWEELPTVSVGDRDRLELPLTLAEFSEALRRMPTNKSPGMDGLTVEFYRAFWDILGPDLVTVWAESLQSGVLPLSCRRAVLALLPKKGDLRDLRNWRPVSLLSTDYKIVAKAISLRLGSVMADVVHPDQTYTVPGRSIFDNLFLVRDLLELGRRDGLSFALLSLDQEKAFDRVDHGYLLSTLQAFGFGPQFVSFLRVLYASAECLVRLNWTLTEPVSFGRGVRQGLYASGQLYALAIEPFLCLLRRRMTGLVLREPELRLVLSAYADDVLLVVQDPGDLARVEACQAIYSAASFARVNWVKSSGLAVGDWRQVSDFLGTLDSHECLVLGGDFNTTLEERDRSGAEPSPAAANILQGIVDHHSLVDVWRDHHPDDTSTFTFVRVEAHRSHHSRLDRIYLSRFHLSQAHSSAVRPAPFSDHHLVTVTVSLRAERPGPAYWHFNNSLLEDESFVMSFREFWLAWREQWRAFPSVRRWWDLGKVRAKLFCRDYTRGTSRRRNAAIEQLEREVLEMERRLAADPEDPSLCGACREKREELRALEDHRARGAFVRSRIHLLREMDRGSRFFYALEKMRGAKKHITCLLAEDGTPLTDPEEMCGRARDFYTSLFSPDPTDPDACEVLWEELPTVSVGDRDRLELPLTLAEFSEALRRMPTNKSPGMDGLTVEFYRAFWDILGPDLVTVWAESLQSGVLPLSCRRAVLALLPKKGDLRDLRNWRPVSLLSTDYKIVAKAISLRLGSVMADVVHPDQTYTVPGRSIFDNLFLVRDLLELGRRDGLSFALLSLDQEKAFDRVDHGYLLSTLQAFGFGPQFVSFLRVLYASAECLVRLNWTLTEPVSFGRGVRQGCPLSGQLYALAIEPFLCLLRRRMTGLVLREPELRLVLSAYADDVLLVVQDPGDLARVEACQAIYSAASSARVNWVKSSGLAVGDWRQDITFQDFTKMNVGLYLSI